MLTQEDTYFESFEEAESIAKQQNIIEPYSKLQLCFYTGNKVETPYKNLIYMPSNEIPKTLLTIGLRPPTQIKLNNGNIIPLHKEYVENLKRLIRPIKKTDSKFAQEVIKNILIYEDEKSKQYQEIISDIKKIKLDFNGSLRFYIGADYGSKVVSNIYWMLRDTIQEMGYELFYEENTNIELMDDFRRAKSIREFKPHITININRVRNEYLNDSMFNMIWFMDPTLVLYDDSKIIVRKNDYFFYLIDNFKLALLNKNVSENKLIKQSFATDEKNLYQIQNIKKDNKIIFIGNNYFEVLSPTSEYKNHHIVNDLTKLFNQDKLTKKKLLQLADEYYLKGILSNKEHLEMFIFPAIVRLEILKWICSQNIIDVEIYGEGWSDVEVIKKHYKGIIKNKTDLRISYNKAKYSLLAHPEFYYQQRLMEASICGSIPIVYQGVNNEENFIHKDNVLIFNNKESLYKCLNQNPIKNPMNIAKDLSYKVFIKKIVNFIGSNKGN